MMFLRSLRAMIGTSTSPFTSGTISGHVNVVAPGRRVIDDQAAGRRRSSAPIPWTHCRQHSSGRKSHFAKSKCFQVFAFERGLAVAQPHVPIERRDATAKTSSAGNFRLGEDVQHFPAHATRGADHGDIVAPSSCPRVRAKRAPLQRSIGGYASVVESASISSGLNCRTIVECQIIATPCQHVTRLPLHLGDAMTVGNRRALVRFARCKRPDSSSRTPSLPRLGPLIPVTKRNSRPEKELACTKI